MLFQYLDSVPNTYYQAVIIAPGELTLLLTSMALHVYTFTQAHTHRIILKIIYERYTHLVKEHGRTARCDGRKK